MVNPSSRRLNCRIEGESYVISVIMESSDTVGELKEAIQKKRALGILKDVDPQILELWKVDINLDLTPKDFLEQQQLANRDALTPSWKPVGEYWADQPPPSHLHIIVKSPAIADEFLAIYQSFWKRGEDIFVRKRVQVPHSLSSELDGNSETLELIVIKLPKGSETVFTTGFSQLLVVPIYETFWDVLTDEDRIWQGLQLQAYRFHDPCHATIITGQPGIGKTIFLIYVLLRRLVNGMVTIYCDRKEYVHIFDHNGVRKLTLASDGRIPELDVNSNCCALVNLGDQLKSVPDVFYPKRRSGRVVVATSPNKKHWSSFSHENPARICCMPTWEWGPLYFASLLYAEKDLNTFDLDHFKAVQNTYSVFRGIPRSCFSSLTSRAFKIQIENIMEALNSRSFMEDFGHAITGQVPFTENTSHRLVRVEPIDTTWLMTRTEIKSNYIAELVFERIRMHKQVQFSDQLMKYLVDRDCHGAAGVLFEQATHYSIRKGLTLTITSLRGGETLDVSIPGIPVEKIEQSRYYSLSIWEKPRSQNVHPDFLDFYMTPKSKNGPSIDALFISSKYTTYLFQITVSRQHPIKFLGLDTVFNTLPARALKDVCIVFIIPAEGLPGEKYKGIEKVQSIDTPQNADADTVKKFKELPQYVCWLDMKKIGWD